MGRDPRNLPVDANEHLIQIQWLGTQPKVGCMLDKADSFINTSRGSFQVALGLSQSRVTMRMAVAVERNRAPSGLRDCVTRPTPSFYWRSGSIHLHRYIHLGQSLDKVLGSTGLVKYHAATHTIWPLTALFERVLQLTDSG